MADTATVQKVADQLQGLIDGLDESQLTAQTPCTEWDVHALLNHLIGGGTLFAACMRDGACPDDLLLALMTEDQVGDDASASWRASADGFLAAATAADGDTVVSTPWGDMPVSVVLDVAAADLTIHSIDLAIATGTDLDSLDSDLLATADELAHRYFAPEGRAPDSFEPPVDTAADVHPARQLAAFAGRSV